MPLLHIGTNQGASALFDIFFGSVNLFPQLEFCLVVCVSRFAVGPRCNFQRKSKIAIKLLPEGLRDACVKEGVVECNFKRTNGGKYV
jgi:hypothetical protein